MITVTTSPRPAHMTPQSLYSPVASLPAELLIEIFLVCATRNALAPLRLAEVCHLWKAVVHTCPHIWRTIRLDDAKIAASQKQARLWIERSAPLAYDVHLDVTSPDHLLSLLAPCLPHVSRWRQVVLTGMREEQVTISDLQMSSLDHLTISIGPEDEELFDYLPKSTFVTYSPLWPGVMALNLWMSSLLPVTPSLHFTTVHITEQSSEIHLSAQSILDFLASCPNARTVLFSGYIHTEEAYTLSKIIPLPHLTSLTLRTTGLIRSILSHIDAPNLQELYLSCLNVDIELPDTEVHEDGDSDDEANDFSMSPSSDRATGMGLRKLLSRCDPPLRVLKMNYSDMRTKDFRYAFKHLQFLEEFEIVASDMSDTVLRLFRDYLPALRRMDLHNCHRFSGEAVVEVVRGRDCSQLEEVVITECVGFLPEHAQILMKELGDKFKDD